MKPSKIPAAAIFWALNAQYFLVQYLVALPWKPGFSLRQNTISDLGNTVCGPYGERFVCSPEHAAMNASFILLGLTTALGALLFWQQQHGKSTVRDLGFLGLALSGIGTALVGIFPENTVSGMHVLGAGLAFVFGNVALVLLGLSFKNSFHRIVTVGLGIVALVALVLFMLGYQGVLGQGGIERLTAYPQTLWMIAYGAARLIQMRQQRGS